MYRLLICLPLCVLMSPSHPGSPLTVGKLPGRFQSVADDNAPLPDSIQMERLARDNPVEFLEACVKRYQRTVKGYTCTLQKQERISGRLLGSEVIDIAFREKPFSVLFKWKEGSRLAEKTLYAEGENDEMLLVRPSGKLARAVAGDLVVRDPEGKDAKASARYSLKEFGMNKGVLRTLASWKDAKARDAFHVEYLGEIKVKEAGDRLCYVLRRSKYPKPEEDGIIELTTYIDKETWLQVGSVLKGEENKLVASYYFRDIKLNPDYKADQFTKAAVGE